MSSTVVGLSGVARHASVAVNRRGRLAAVCGQERATRVRGAGFNRTGIPDEALDMVLDRLGLSRTDVDSFAMADEDPHRALACASYLTSPYDVAVIVVCDEEAPKVSVWKGDGSRVTRVDWPWRGPGWVELHARCASAFGFSGDGADQRFEALARLSPGCRDEALEQMLAADEESVWAHPALECAIEERLVGDPLRQAPVAASLQARVADLFVQFLARVRQRTGRDDVCLAGTFFARSSVNTAARLAGSSQVFVPVDPGHGGRAVGGALDATGAAPAVVSPFLGPAYTDIEAKATLDNCKLQYALESEDGAIAAALRALGSGNLVAWFDGAMEWGPRALGARSILASPLSSFMLENLNHFLKRREPWRGYAVSCLEEDREAHFAGPDMSPYMECEYQVKDAASTRHILPVPGAGVRVHTVGHDGPPRFRRLLEMFKGATGVPFLVNTSFNGFSEPIVCSPRDAVRVFYGSGLDLLVLNRFVLTK